MTILVEEKHDSNTLVRKLWQYCNILRDDGLSYPDYVEQLTYLLFLKMSDEQNGGTIPQEYGWSSLKGLDATSMHHQYSRILSMLGKHGGMLGIIFGNAKNKIRDPAKLRLLIVELIGQTEWTGLSTDLKGDAYEGLLEKNARDTKSGAGQYFTPRPLIEAIVRCMAPRLGELIWDPACGTAGFLLAAYDHLKHSNPNMTREQHVELATRSLRGAELVEEVARLATMNLLLHGVGGSSDGELPVVCQDSLKEPPTTQADIVLTNPPFGIKGSVTYSQTKRSSRSDEALTVIRPDFWVQTANKQLNFLQHIVALLKPGGRAAVVIPDNVLFETGAASAIRRRLLESCRIHTLLRLPPGLFYAHSVKSNVLFFNRKHTSIQEPASDTIWVYNLRSDKRYSIKTKPLQREELHEFVALFQSNFSCPSSKIPVEECVRFRNFDARKILATDDCNLDLTWGDGTDQARAPGLARLEELSRLVADDLQRALGLIAKPRT